MLRKTVAENQRDWHERLPEALWSYRTSVQLSTGVTPFMLVYGAEAVLPVEIELPALRLAAATNIQPSEEVYAQERIAALERLDEFRRNAGIRLQRYRKKMEKYYNKHAVLRSFQPGTLVLVNTKEVRANLPRPKFAPSWEGPYVIYADVGKGCYDLNTLDGDNVFRVNAKYLKFWRDPSEGGHHSV